MTDDRIIRTLPADLLTPVGAYLLLREALGAPAFLLESVERGEQVGRHSFLAAGCETTDSLERGDGVHRHAPRARAPATRRSWAARSATSATTGRRSWSRCRCRPPTRTTPACR